MESTQKNWARGIRYVCVSSSSSSSHTHTLTLTNSTATLPRTLPHSTTNSLTTLHKMENTTHNKIGPLKKGMLHTLHKVSLQINHHTPSAHTLPHLTNQTHKHTNTENKQTTKKHTTITHTTPRFPPVRDRDLIGVVFVGCV